MVKQDHSVPEIFDYHLWTLCRAFRSWVMRLKQVSEALFVDSIVSEYQEKREKVECMIPVSVEIVRETHVGLEAAARSVVYHQALDFEVIQEIMVVRSERLTVW